jgi:hypothetical protein
LRAEVIHEQLIKYLTDAHAIEEQSLGLLKRARRACERGELREIYERTTIGERSDDAPTASAAAGAPGTGDTDGTGSAGAGSEAAPAGAESLADTSGPGPAQHLRTGSARMTTGLGPLPS